MSLRGFLFVSQTRPGAPLVIDFRLIANNADDDNYSYVGVGTTTTATPPATIADLAHKDMTEWNKALLGQGVATEVLSHTGNADASAYTRYADTVSYGTVTKALDSNYAAGKYLWGFLTLDDPTSGGTALLAVSRSYHIR